MLVTTEDFERYTSNKFKRKMLWNFNQICNPITQSNGAFGELAELRAALNPKDQLAQRVWQDYKGRNNLRQSGQRVKLGEQRSDGSGQGDSNSESGTDSDASDFDDDVKTSGRRTPRN